MGALNICAVQVSSYSLLSAVTSLELLGFTDDFGERCGRAPVLTSYRTTWCYLDKCPHLCVNVWSPASGCTFRGVHVHTDTKRLGGGGANDVSK